MVSQFIDLFLHLDQHLAIFVELHGAWVYLLLFVIVFMETGVVVTPFLPGDSLLFVAGALAGIGQMELWKLCLTLMVAALCGDNLNYWIGRWLGPKVFSFEKSRFLKKENLNKTQAFMERHGPKAIIIARFVPIIRTFVPFVSGIGQLHYRRFIFFSSLAAALWVGLLVPVGYFFGNMEIVKKNLSIVILLIVFISILPGIIEFLRERKRSAQR